MGYKGLWEDRMCAGNIIYNAPTSFIGRSRDLYHLYKSLLLSLANISLQLPPDITACEVLPSTIYWQLRHWLTVGSDYMGCALNKYIIGMTSLRYATVRALLFLLMRELKHGFICMAISYEFMQNCIYFHDSLCYAISSLSFHGNVICEVLSSRTMMISVECRDYIIWKELGTLI